MGAHDAAQKLLGFAEVPRDLRANVHPQVPSPHAYPPGVLQALAPRNFAAEDRYGDPRGLLIPCWLQ
eukprot:1052198-Alexandrium_andersonii.AAC.1